MVDKDIDLALEKARAFFDRAEQVAATDNFDYAIEMYLEGIKRAPDALEDGHLALRRMALLRQGKGGKKPSLMDKMKHRGGKNALEEMLNAEYLFAKDPDNQHHAKAMMEAALKGDYKRTTEWITDLFFAALRAEDKPAVAEVLLVRDVYEELELYDKAVAACMLAAKLKPDDGVIADSVKNLSAKATLVKGRYEQKGDFRKSIQDRDAQSKLHDQQAVVKTKDYREVVVEEARKEFLKAPHAFTSRVKLAKALADLETREAFDEAYDLLEDAYDETNDFSYKRQQGELKIKFLRRQLSDLRKKHEADPQNSQIKADFTKLAAEITEFELEHYRSCVEKNPADLNLKFEYGNRLLYKKQFEEAIPFFQAARKNIRLRIPAMDKLGICFFNKGWYADAIDIFEQAAELYEISDDSIGKELRYNLARAYEQDENFVKALEIYRKLAQLDYNYKDVRSRVDSLRAQIGQ